MTARAAVPWRAALRAAVFTAACAALASSASAAETISVAVFGSPPAESLALDRAIAAFTLATGIAVKKETIGDKYMDVIRSRFAARKTPDVFYLDSHEAPMLIRSGVLEPFDSAAVQAQEFYPQFVDAFRGADSKVYGLPKDYSTLALYVNTRLLAKAGFKPAQVPANFVDLMDFARRIQPSLPKGTAAMIYEKDLARHLSAFEAFGTPAITPSGDASLASNPGALAYLETFVRGRQAGYVVSPKDDLGADSPVAAFGTEKTVMMLDGNWVLSALRKDYADVPFVTLEMPLVNGRKHTMAFVVGWSVPRYAKNKSGGFKFAQFMTQAGMKDWSKQSGTLPTRASVQAALSLGADPALAAHVAGAAYATVWSRGIGLPVVNTNFGNQFLAAMNGSKSVRDAMLQAERASNREIERQK